MRAAYSLVEGRASLLQLFLGWQISPGVEGFRVAINLDPPLVGRLGKLDLTRPPCRTGASPSAREAGAGCRAFDRSSRARRRKGRTAAPTAASAPPRPACRVRVESAERPSPRPDRSCRLPFAPRTPTCVIEPPGRLSEIVIPVRGPRQGMRPRVPTKRPDAVLELHNLDVFRVHEDGGFGPCTKLQRRAGVELQHSQGGAGSTRVAVGTSSRHCRLAREFDPSISARASQVPAILVKCDVAVRQQSWAVDCQPISLIPSGAQQPASSCADAEVPRGATKRFLFATASAASGLAPTAAIARRLAP